MKRRKKVGLPLVMLLSLIIVFSGCEGFRKKFVRKRKQKNTQEEMVIVPRDYNEHPFPPDVLYKQYFVYWKAWNQELVTALHNQSSDKKILSCAEQSYTNLKKMSTYLNDEKVEELKPYLEKTERLREEIASSGALLPSLYTNFKYKAERILSNVNRKFDLRRMKDYLR